MAEAFVGPRFREGGGLNSTQHYLYPSLLRKRGSTKPPDSPKTQENRYNSGFCRIFAGIFDADLRLSL